MTREANYGSTGTSKPLSEQERELPSGKREQTEAEFLREENERLRKENRHLVFENAMKDEELTKSQQKIEKLNRENKAFSERQLSGHAAHSPLIAVSSTGSMQRPDVTPPQELVPLSGKNKAVIAIVAALAAFTEAYFRVKALEKLFFHKSPIPVWGSTLVAVTLAPSDVGLEYVEAASFYKTYIKNAASWGHSFSNVLSQGTFAALLPAAAELCIFSLALKDDLTWPGALFLSSIAAVQYLMIEGESLNRLLKEHVFAQDRRHIKSKKCADFDYPGLARALLANAGNFFAASVYLIPAFTDSHGLFLRWFGQGGKHDHERIPTYLATALLCSAYLGGQLCLMGHEMKHLVFHFDKLCTLIGSQWQKSGARWGWLKRAFILCLVLVATPASGAVAYFFLTEGLRAIFPIKGHPTWLIVLGSVLALPTALQYVVTKGLRAVTLMNKDAAAWQAYMAEDNAPKPGNRHTRTPALSFCRFYLMMLGIGCTTTAKMGFELFNPSQSVGEMIFSYGFSALVALALHVLMLDVLPFVRRGFSDTHAAEKTCLSARRVPGFCGWRVLHFVLTCAVGVGAQLVLHRLFRLSTSDAEAAEFRSECGGGLVQAIFAMGLGFYLVGSEASVSQGATASPVSEATSCRWFACCRSANDRFIEIGSEEEEEETDQRQGTAFAVLAQVPDGATSASAF